MVVDEGDDDSFENPVDRGELGEDVDVVPLLVDHSFYAADLSLKVAEAVAASGLVADVTMDALRLKGR